MGVIVGGLLWLILCALCAAFAERKGHKGIGYFLLAFFLSPLISGIIVLCISDKNKKECPYCRKFIAINAAVCPYCNKEIIKKKTSSDKEKWISQRIVALIGSGKTATDAKIQAEAEYSVNQSKPADDSENKEQNSTAK